MKRCPRCTCTDENACVTIWGACTWLVRTDLCSACLFPTIRLSGPQVEDARTISPEGPLTLDVLCLGARAGDADSVRWFWAVYGRELRLRLEHELAA
jgi:hypothetical protein